jgi:hypothetical protein
MGVSFAIVRAAASTGGGNQDFTVSGFGTPKGAIFIGSGGSSDGTAADGAIMSFGCTDGTNELVTSYTTEHNVANSNTYRLGASDEVIQFGDHAGAIDGEANFNSWITDGVRVTWGNAPGTAFLVTCILIGGSDLSVDVGTASIPSAINDTVDVGCGFEPDQVLFFGNGASFSTDGSSFALMWLGMANNGVGIEQGCGVFAAVDNAVNSDVAGRIDTTYSVINHGGASISRAAELTAFNAGPSPAAGFTLTQKGPSTFSNTTGYMALYYNSAVDHSIEQIDTPTATGNDAQTGPGFTPQFVMQIMGMWSAYNTSYTNSQAGAFGISAFTADDEYSIATADEDAAATMNTQSVADDQAVNLDEEDGTAAFDATFVSMDANGWTTNFSAVNGTTRKWLALAVEEFTTAGTTIPIMMHQYRQRRL